MSSEGVFQYLTCKSVKINFIFEFIKILFQQVKLKLPYPHIFPPQKKPHSKPYSLLTILLTLRFRAKYPNFQKAVTALYPDAMQIPVLRNMAAALVYDDLAA